MNSSLPQSFSREACNACVYVFVVLNKPGIAPDYYIVPGEDFHSKPDKFGKWFHDYEKFPGVHPNDLPDYRDNWKIFEI